MEGTKFICFLEIFRLLYVGLSALIYGLRRFSYYMLAYYIGCNVYAVFILLTYVSILAYKTFKVLSQKPLDNWEIVRKYFKSKLVTIIIWVGGYSIFMVVCWMIDVNELIELGNTVPIGFGVILDLYFTYCVFSCYKLGISGKFKVLPQIGINQVERFTIQNGEPSAEIQCFRSENIKEIIAFPEQNFIDNRLQENNIMLCKDFTENEIDNLEEINLKS